MTRSQPHGATTDATGEAKGAEVTDDFPCCVSKRVPRTLRIVAHGQPAAQGSKKAFKRGKKVVLVEMSEHLPEWRATVEAAARLAAGQAWEPIDNAVSIRGEIRLRKPNTTKYPDHPAGAPDLDKLQRAIGDALTKSRVIIDDARIIRWDIRKVWAESVPGMDITITEES